MERQHFLVVFFVKYTKYIKQWLVVLVLRMPQKKTTIGLNWLLVRVFQFYQKGTVQQRYNLLCWFGLQYPLVN